MYQQYSGPGKDCASDSFIRPGFLSMFPGNSGIPGMSGGKQRKQKRRSKRRSMRGGTNLTVASYENPVGNMLSSPPTQVSAQVSAPGVPTHPAEAASGGAPATPPAMPAQTGGRYESNPGSPLDPVSGIGMGGYAPINSIACERGYVNPLNQHSMNGGAMLASPIELRMPNAGYSHQFETLAGTSAVGGLMLNTPYDASASNPACSTTGGKRSTRTRRSKRTRRSRTRRGKKNHKNRK